MTKPVTKPTHLFINPDPRPGTHDTNTLDAIIWWTPTLGPTATIAAAHLANHAINQPRTPLAIADLQTMLGVTEVAGRCWRAINRLERFGMLTWHSTNTITIRTQLPSLRPKQLARLPEVAVAVYSQRMAST